MAFLMSAIDVHAPSGVWQWFIINVFGFIKEYGWRIVVLVVLLKLLLSPLDFYQKYKMRKNQRITEALKPQMDKLEKQYGADPQMLQRKQMELQRSSGFSYMSACLPLIITLVLFITFFTALRSVSSYMEFKQYVGMYDAYVAAYNETGFDYEARLEKGFYLNDKVIVKTYEKGEDGEVTVKTDESEINYDEVNAWIEETISDKALLRETFSSEEINGLLTSEDVKLTVDSAMAAIDRYERDYSSYEEYVKANKGGLLEIDKGASKDEQERIDSINDLNLTMSILMQVRAQEAAYEAYESDHASFLWIKSLWIADVPWLDSVPTYDTFKSTVGNYLDFTKNPGRVYEQQATLFNDMAGGGRGVKAYDIVTAKVRKGDASKHNGYLVMVILVVGLSLLSQFISTRQQKKAGQVNGQNMGMMKVMMFIMPIMLGVFALTSSSAFTLYMVTNSIMTLIINFLTTLIVNLMDGSYKQKDVEVVKYGRQDPNDLINKRNKK